MGQTILLSLKWGRLLWSPAARPGLAVALGWDECLSTTLPPHTAHPRGRGRKRGADTAPRVPDAFEQREPRVRVCVPRVRRMSHPIKALQALTGAEFGVSN